MNNYTRYGNISQPLNLRKKAPLSPLKAGAAAINTIKDRNTSRNILFIALYQSGLYTCNALMVEAN